MAKVAMYNMEGKRLGDLDLSDLVFGIIPNQAVMHQALLRQLANARRGTASTKTRGDVRGGGKKPWRQKGTGRARHGSRRSPIWRGGGTVFGPHPRDYTQAMPRKMRRLALRSALSAKAAGGELVALEALALEYPRTAPFLAMMKALELPPQTLFIVKKRDELLDRSAGNIPQVKVLGIDEINLHDIVHYRRLVMTKEAISTVEEVLSR